MEKVTLLGEVAIPEHCLPCQSRPLSEDTILGKVALRGHVLFCGAITASAKLPTLAESPYAAKPLSLAKHHCHLPNHLFFAMLWSWVMILSLLNLTSV
jgi:hypothetical protein